MAKAQFQSRGLWKQSLDDDIARLQLTLSSEISSRRLMHVFQPSKVRPFLKRHADAVLRQEPHQPRRMKLGDVIARATVDGLNFDLEALRWMSFPEVWRALAIGEGACRELAADGCFGELRSMSLDARIDRERVLAFVIDMHMLGVPNPLLRARAWRRDGTACAVEGCSKPSRVQGLCLSCIGAARRGSPFPVRPHEVFECYAARDGHHREATIGFAVPDFMAGADAAFVQERDEELLLSLEPGPDRVPVDIRPPVGAYTSPRVIVSVERLVGTTDTKLLRRVEGRTVRICRSPSQPALRKRRLPAKCLHGGCSQPVANVGLCAKHLRDLNRFDPGDRCCRVPTCDEPFHSLGLCRPHQLEAKDFGWRWGCLAPGCEAKAWNKHLCETHRPLIHDVAAHGGLLRAILLCSEPGCDEVFYGRGMCHRHYAAWRKRERIDGLGDRALCSTGGCAQHARILGRCGPCYRRWFVESFTS